MSEKSEKEKTSGLKLTDSLITGLDLGRVIRELSDLDDKLHQAKLRQTPDDVKFPKTTEMLQGLAEANDMSLADADERRQLLDDLRQLREKGKKIHISFAVEPSPAVIRKIAVWLRDNIHKNLILEVGLQPAISVGCVVRTTNKVFDMSLRSRFASSKGMLNGLMEDRK